MLSSCLTAEPGWKFQFLQSFSEKVDHNVCIEHPSRSSNVKGNLR